MEIPFQDDMKFGLGYNSLTGDVLPSPAVQGSTSSIAIAEGQRVIMNCVTIEDTETLHKSLGVDVAASGSYGPVSASVKVNYANSMDQSSYSKYVMIQVSVQNAEVSFDSPTFTQDANDLLVNNDPVRFRQRFGDVYVDGLKTGGEFFAVYQITSTSDTERESLAGEVHAAYDGVFASAELSVKINTAKEQSKSHLEVQVYVYREGTIREADITVEDIIATARAFPPAVSSTDAFPYTVALMPYTALKQPNDSFNYIQIDQQQQVLEDTAKRRFQFLQLRDDLAYVLKYPDNFQNSDGSAIDPAKIDAMRIDVVNAINTMEQQAIACSKDATKCALTTFDVGEFPVPPLKKDAPTITLPNFIGLTASALGDVTTQLGIDWADPDDYEGGTNAPVLLGNPGNSYKEMLLGYTDQDGHLVYHSHTPDQIVVVGMCTLPGAVLAKGTTVLLRFDLAPAVQP